MSQLIHGKKAFHELDYVITDEDIAENNGNYLPLILRLIEDGYEPLDAINYLAIKLNISKEILMESLKEILKNKRNLKDEHLFDE